MRKKVRMVRIWVKCNLKKKDSKSAWINECNQRAVIKDTILQVCAGCEDSEDSENSEKKNLLRCIHRQIKYPHYVQ
ncbi:hypothetical protein ACFL08_02340 [Patescibacteria group bacterium]